MAEVFGLTEADSGVNLSIDNIESENVNLITVNIDSSGSMNQYEVDMINCIKDFKKALKNSKEGDMLLVSRNDFNGNLRIHGFNKIENMDEQYRANGNTRLYDCIVETATALLSYSDRLRQNGMRVKVVFSVFSDGEDTSSKVSFSQAKSIIEELNNREFITAFISFGGNADKVATDLGFSNILKVGGSSTELRRAFDVLSKSVINASKAVVVKKDDFFNVI